MFSYLFVLQLRHVDDKETQIYQKLTPLDDKIY